MSTKIKKTKGNEVRRQEKRKRPLLNSASKSAVEDRYTEIAVDAIILQESEQDSTGRAPIYNIFREFVSPTVHAKRNNMK